MYSVHVMLMYIHIFTPNTLKEEQKIKCFYFPEASNCKKKYRKDKKKSSIHFSFFLLIHSIQSSVCAYLCFSFSSASFTHLQEYSQLASYLYKVHVVN